MADQALSVRPGFLESKCKDCAYARLTAWDHRLYFSRIKHDPTCKRRWFKKTIEIPTYIKIEKAYCRKHGDGNAEIEATDDACPDFIYGPRAENYTEADDKERSDE